MDKSINLLEMLFSKKSREILRSDDKYSRAKLEVVNTYSWFILISIILAFTLLMTLTYFSVRPLLIPAAWLPRGFRKWWPFTLVLIRFLTIKKSEREMIRKDIYEREMAKEKEASV